MGLDNATVKEFANLINPFDKTSGEATVYGRVVGFNEIGGRPIVNLDGSTQNIPIRTTVKVKGPKGSPGDQDYYAGDRVLVRIKNHEALIVSNISTQMTTAEGAEDAAKQYVSDNGFIYAEKITGEQGDFYTLSADKFTATEITGALGHFITVNADNVITDAINAQIARIDTIKASDVIAGEGYFKYLNVDNVLDAKMANLDTAHINKANVGSLLAEMGLISSATIVEGHVTGYLDSVEVNANKITAGTLLVDRLYIKDQNNKWKMQTVDDQGHAVYVEASDRINERTITADKLVARSITTDELNVSNLTASDSVFMTALTNTLEAEEIFVSYEEADSIIAGKIAADLAELDILNINEELKTQNSHLGEIVFDQPVKPSVMSGNPDYILGIERETKTISAYDSTALYSEGDYVTHYYSKDNMMVYPYNDTTKTKNGITFTDNGDGSITCNGTATADAVFYCSVRGETGKCVLSNGSYIVNGCPSGGATSSYYIVASSTRNGTNANYGSDLGSGISITLNGDDFGTDDVRVQIRIDIKSDTTVNNLTFKPKIRLATNEDATWYPFIKGVYKCIKPITTAELWDENKWYYLRDAVSGDQYEFDHVRYTNKIKADESTVTNTLHLGNVNFDQSNKPAQFTNHNIPFFLGIEAFADGGAVKWANAKTFILNVVYPVGSMYISVVHTSPETFLGGTWIEITDAVLKARASSDAAAGNYRGNNSELLGRHATPYHLHRASLSIYDTNLHHEHYYSQYVTAKTGNNQSQGIQRLDYESDNTCCGATFEQGGGRHTESNLGNHTHGGRVFVDQPVDSDEMPYDQEKYKTEQRSYLVYIWRRTA